MQIVAEPIQKVNGGIPHQDEDSLDEQQAEDLFNQINVDSNQKKNQHPQQQLENAINQPQFKQKTPKKIKKKVNMLLDSDNDQQQVNHKNLSLNQQHGTKMSKKDKKQRKLQKKQRKRLKKQKKDKKRKKQGKLRKMKQQREQGQNKKGLQSEQWSGQSSNQQEESDLSSDSLLQRLNPNKKKNKSAKKHSTEKKQGFLLKQLGNDGEVNYQNQQEVQGDSSYDSNNRNKKKKTEKIQKKQLSKNQQILKSLLQIGLCVEQQKEQNKKQGQIDNGLQQVYNMKNIKKKGPKIANKLFANMQINQDEHHQPMPKQIQLQVKPRIRQGPSIITSSFLSKVQKIRKVRGMQSQMLHQQYEKMISFKARQSMVKLINQKQLQQAEEIDLQVKVPQVIKGKQQLNNSMFLKRISSGSLKDSKSSLQKEEANKKQAESRVNYTIKTKSKISRFDFFKSISQDLKSRKSRDISDDIIKNNFRVTQLQQIEQMRKKNEQKRRKQALRGSDDQQEQQSFNKKDQVVQNNLAFMNVRVQLQKQNMEEQKQVNSQNKQIEIQNKKSDQLQEIKQKERNLQNIRKTKSVSIQIKDCLPDDQYRKLLLLEEGILSHQQNQNQNQQQPDNEQLNQILKGPKHAQQIEMQNQGQLQQNQDDQQQNVNQIELDSAEKVDLQVELDVLNSQQNELNQQQDPQQEQKQLQNKQEPINQQYQQYLNQLEEEGIKLNKRQNRKKQQHKLQRSLSEQKQNNKLIQNHEKSQQNVDQNEELTQARRQFKKLRKLATIIKQRKQNELKTQRARQFYDQEAQQGSDNEEHDHQVKKINRQEQQEEYEGIDLDADLQQMIDNAVDINQQDQQLAFRKYLEDVKIQDRQELKRIMKGDFKRRRDHQPIMDQMDEDQKKRVQRMQEIQQYIKKKQMQQGQGLYMKDDHQNQKQHQEDQQLEEEVDNQYKIQQQKKKNQVQSTQEQQFEQLDQMNEQNLMRYLDDAIADNWRSKVKVKKTVISVPQSCQRSKKVSQMRNTMKPKGIQQINTGKLKKTSSHLNQMIMKNKQKVKPIVFTKNFSVLSRR